MDPAESEDVDDYADDYYSDGWTNVIEDDYEYDVYEPTTRYWVSLNYHYGSWWYDYYWRDYWYYDWHYYPYYSSTYSVVHEPGYTIENTVVSVETNLYDVQSEVLKWAAVSETLNVVPQPGSGAGCITFDQPDGAAFPVGSAVALSGRALGL